MSPEDRPEATFIPPDDRYQWGASISDYGEILYGSLDAAGVDTVLEIGAFQGRLTEALLDWAGKHDADVAAVEIDPPEELRAVQAAHPELTVIETTSLEAIPAAPRFDAVIVDGDHNWFTVTRELEAIAARAEAEASAFPLTMLHDIGWPHARRDTYYAPERIPDEFRQPVAREVWLDPSDPGLTKSGLFYDCAAVREGGPRNGTLTAVEDFLATEAGEGLEFAVIPAFFGLGVLWPRSASWSEAVSALLSPYDRNPLLMRLEANRVQHLVRRDVQARILHQLAHSGTFKAAEMMSKIRNLGTPAVSVQDIGHASDMGGPSPSDARTLAERDG
ncbi:MAG: class I SAM-dependent methyltransferase [bacterium]